jgi:hypothetical protein
MPPGVRSLRATFSSASHARAASPPRARSSMASSVERDSEVASSRSFAIASSILPCASRMRASAGDTVSSPAICLAAAKKRSASASAAVTQRRAELPEAERSALNRRMRPRDCLKGSRWRAEQTRQSCAVPETAPAAGPSGIATQGPAPAHPRHPPQGFGSFAKAEASPRPQPD